METPNIQLPLVSMIVVNYHTPDLVLHLMSTLYDSSLEMVIVDNSPTIELERQLARHPKAIYIKNGRNLGFAGGVNAGLKVANGEWVYLLNTDANTTPSDVLALMHTAQEHHALVAAPQLVRDDESIEKNVGYFSSSLSHALDWLLARPRLIDPQLLTIPTNVDVATGGALLVHKSVFEKIGTFDAKHFFMYFEDIDFSLRLNSNRVSILYVPAIRVRHSGGGSSDQDLTTKTQNYLTSLHAYVLKHRGPFMAWLNTKLRLFT
jgi:GT2 family glycosyltransferase